MLPFDFEYYRPKTLQEAVQLYQYMQDLGRQPMYISGTTELITLGRIDLVYTEAVIDIKDIVECRMMEHDGDHLVLGSALTLTAIEEADLFPLLTKTSSEIADHTARGKITVGGNICGQIFYREAVLPFLLVDSQAVVIGPQGVKVHYINDIFQKELQLGKGELLVQLATERKYIHAPFISIKRRQQWDTGYPLLTVAAVKIGGEVRVAVSGLCPFPFRSKEMEAAISQGGAVPTRVSGALDVLPAPILDDIEGSAEYRKFVLQNLLTDILLEFDSINA
jgi:aerobic carbon-monoxide dehydrogenase medium subunit